MALTKITSRILDSSGVTTVGTISTGVWQGTAINQTYLVGQSGTNTGDETLARINALNVTELGTISSGVWNGTAINQTYLVGQSGTNTGDETLARINALDVTELGTISSGVWNGTAIASAYLDADTAHLSTTQTFTGAKTFSSGGIFSSSSQGKLKLVAGSNEYLSLEFANASGTTQWEISKNNTHDLYFYKGGYKMMLKADGKVGIGTTSPASKLTVVGGTSTFVYDNSPQGTASSVYRDAVFGSTQTVNTGITIFGTGQTGIAFGDAASHIRGQVRYQHSSDTLELGAAGNINLSISSGGLATFSNDIELAKATRTTIYTSASNANLHLKSVGGNVQLNDDSTGNVEMVNGGGNVGIGGITNPTYRIEANTTSGGNGIKILRGADSMFEEFQSTSGIVSLAASGSNGSFSFRTGTTVGTTTPRLTISSGGFVGIGITLPSDKLHVENGNIRLKSNSDGSTGILKLFDASGSESGQVYPSGGDLRIYSPNDVIFNMGGDVLIGTTDTTIKGKTTIEYGSNTTTNPTLLLRNGGGSAAFATFSTGTGATTLFGYIQRSGSGINYASNSDYRLKENVTPITDALYRLNQLKPSRFNFIGYADNTVDGFIAHEVQDIIPESICGEKDGMREEEYEVTPRIEEVLDEEGNVITEAVEAVMETRSVPDYQGIDQSKIVPLLTAAIQEQQTIIEDLKSRIQTLEG